MNGEPASEIRFFSYSSRIGRVRYLAYAIGTFLLLLPAMILASILLAIKLVVAAIILFVAIYVFMLTMTFVFAVRRLHDINVSGWWVLINAAGLVAGIASVFNLIPVMVPTLLGLAELILFLVLLFMPGTQGDNDYGPVPPPNSAWVVAGAWFWITVPFFGGMLAAIAIPAYQDYLARSQTSEAIRLAGAAMAPASEYYQKNKAWPTDLSPLYGGPEHAGSIGKFVATVTPVVSADGSFGAIASMKQTGVNRLIAGKGVELWTNNGGNIWHCGPASTNPVDPKFLPTSCRETAPPPP